MSRRGSIATPGANTPGAPAASQKTDASGTIVKKFLNGWTKEQETLMAEWADVAGCYRWLHDRAEKIFSGSNMWITIPVIVLSTLTGTANFAVGSFIPENDQQLKKYVAAGIGGISIFAGILTTLGNFFQYAQKSEAHKVAGIAWGKFQRQVAVELAIHPDERIEAMDFLKICRQDLDRLIEQSPPVPDAVVAAFEKEFKDIPNLKVPDICHGIEHTRVYDASKTRLSKITADAALHLKYRKAALRETLLPDFDKRIASSIEKQLDQVREQLKRDLAPVAQVSPSPAASGGSTPVSSLETDWRRLLTNRHHILAVTSPPVAATQQEDEVNPPNLIVDSSQVRINIVGTDGPITASSDGSVRSGLGPASAPGSERSPRPTTPVSTRVDFA